MNEMIGLFEIKKDKDEYDIKYDMICMCGNLIHAKFPFKTPTIEFECSKCGMSVKIGELK